MRFAVKRNVQMLDEFSWATLGTPLPKKAPKPPDWVRLSICRFSETGFKRLNALKPIDGKATMPQLQEMLGIGAAYGSILANPLSEFAADAPDDVKAMVVDLSQSIVRNAEPSVNKLTKSLRNLAPKLRPATLPEFQANTKAFNKGASSVSVVNGPANQELYQLLWFFWPMFEGIRPARKLFEAVESVTDLKFGWKTFESVCAELGIFKGSRGRPRAKKILRSEK